MTPDSTPTNEACARPRLPEWLKKKNVPPGRYRAVAGCIAGNKLHTVCSEAKCPNRAECFSAGTATFLVMGTRCTRACSFCGVTGGRPLPLDGGEPDAVAEAAAALNLTHAVVTSVTRDDLPDGGAAHLAGTVNSIRKRLPGTAVELLIPDLKGDLPALDTVLSASPDVLGHNIETVPRLYPSVRPGAEYRRSLDLLAYCSRKGAVTKSGLMLGLGETDEEVRRTLEEIYRTGTRLVTIGQYLRPSAEAAPVERFVSPQEFAGYERFCGALGFAGISSGPFVRSSYRADELLASVKERPGRSAGRSA